MGRAASSSSQGHNSTDPEDEDEEDMRKADTGGTGGPGDALAASWCAQASWGLGSQGLSAQSREDIAVEVQTLCSEAAAALAFADSEDHYEILDAFFEARHYKHKVNHPVNVAFLQHVDTEDVQEQSQKLFSELSEGGDVVTPERLALMCSSFQIDAKNLQTGRNFEGGSCSAEEYEWLMQGMQEALPNQQFLNVFVLWQAFALQLGEIKTRGIAENEEDINGVDVTVRVRLPNGQVPFCATFGWVKAYVTKGGATFIRDRASIMEFRTSRQNSVSASSSGNYSSPTEDSGLEEQPDQEASSSEPPAARLRARQTVAPVRQTRTPSPPSDDQAASSDLASLD